MTGTEAFEVTCSCVPYFHQGPRSPDCPDCAGTGKRTLLQREVTYRVVTTQTYEVTVPMEVGPGAAYFEEHMLSSDTWADPAPPPIDADITGLELRVDGQWVALERDMRWNGQTGEFHHFYRLGDLEHDDADELIRPVIS